MKGFVRISTAFVISAAALFFSSCGSNGGNQSASSQAPDFPPATVPLTKLSTDMFSNASSQHATEIEPGSFAVGSTIITSFQVGRISSGGAADIGFAVSNDGGSTWQNGLLPGLTTFQGGGTNSAATDTNVAFDAASDKWLISSLTLGNNRSTQVAVSSSIDGGANWSAPVIVAQSVDLDKTWLVCDNTPASPNFGNCYEEWDDNSNNNQVFMATSTDAGATWTKTAITGANGLGGQPLVQPNGNVIVPFLGNSPTIQSFSSTNGGQSWGGLAQVGAVEASVVQGGLRDDSLPSAQEDAAGNIYVVWQDCRFRANCSSNDLVMSTSANGTTWSSPARIPIDPTNSGADHFIPGLAIDPATSGAGAHLGLTYYYYPQANCTAATCGLFVGFISSADGGNTWSAATPVAGPMSLNWLPSTDNGLMVADYIATSFSGGKAYGFFAVANAKSGSTFDEAIYTTQSGFNVAAAPAVSSSTGEKLVARAQPRLRVQSPKARR